VTDPQCRDRHDDREHYLPLRVLLHRHARVRHEARVLPNEVNEVSIDDLLSETELRDHGSAKRFRRRGRGRRQFDFGRWRPRELDLDLVPAVGVMDLESAKAARP